MADPAPGMGTPTSPAPAALLVGATGGIGTALATVLAEEGYAASLTGRRHPEVSALAAKIRARGSSAEAVIADLERPGDATAAIAAHVAAFGRLDLLVVTSGVTYRSPIAHTELATARRVIEINVLAILELLEAALPALRSAASETGAARVVLLSSLVARSPAPKYALYSATKAALNSLAHSVNEEENAHGVRATALCPGFVDTPLTQGFGESQTRDFLPASDIGEALRFLLRLSPLARVAELEIARVKAPRGTP